LKIFIRDLGSFLALGGRTIAPEGLRKARELREGAFARPARPGRRGTIARGSWRRRHAPSAAGLPLVRERPRLSNASPQGTEGDSRGAVDPLTRLRRELPLRWSNYLSNSSPQGEVDRGNRPGTEGVNRGAADPPHLGLCTGGRFDLVMAP
jgi:hypothetical protein